MTDAIPDDRDAEAGTAGEARRAAEKAPREDRDRWQGFSAAAARKTAAEAPPPETPPETDGTEDQIA